MPLKPGQRTSSTSGCVAQPARRPPRRCRRARPSAGAACAARGGRGSSRTARAPRRPRSARSARCSCSAGVAHDHRAADHVGVPAEVLGRRVHDDVGAELERALVDRRGERVVDGDERVAPAASITPAMSITLSGGLVGVSTQISACRRGPPRATRVEVGLVDQVVLQAPAAEHLVDEPVGAAVEVVREHDVIAGRADRGDQRVLGGHARGERGRRGRPPARRAPPRARSASGSPSASSRSPRRTRPARAARRSSVWWIAGMTEP